MTGAQEDLFGAARGSGQTAGEDYYTPAAVADFCLRLLPWGGYKALEPHAGGGAFCRALEGLGVAYNAFDIDPECPAIQQGLARPSDFFRLDPRVYYGERTVGNPPFSNAEEHVDHALKLTCEVAFLLPASRWDAGERCVWYQSAPLRHVWLLAERVWPGSRQVGWFWFDRSWPHPWWGTEVVSWKASGPTSALTGGAGWTGGAAEVGPFPEEDE